MGTGEVCVLLMRTPVELEKFGVSEAPFPVAVAETNGDLVD